MTILHLTLMTTSNRISSLIVMMVSAVAAVALPLLSCFLIFKRGCLLNVGSTITWFTIPRIVPVMAPARSIIAMKIIDFMLLVHLCAPIIHNKTNDMEILQHAASRGRIHASTNLRMLAHLVLR